MTPTSNDVEETPPPLATSLLKLATSVDLLLAQNTELRRLGQAIVDNAVGTGPDSLIRSQLVDDLADYLTSIS